MLTNLVRQAIRPIWRPARRVMVRVVREETSPVLQMRSSLCRERDFSAPWFQKWSALINQAVPPLSQEEAAVWGLAWACLNGHGMHRKIWEWNAICQALDERGMLRPGRRGIGFAVGTEPLSSLFAERGVELVSSDFQGEDADATWSATGQLGDSLKNIHWERVLPFERFQSLVEYRNVDMRDLGPVPKGEFDFSWSSCAFEHLGSLEAGLQFLESSLDCLKPGGIAVHTTEYNVSSNEATIETGQSVIYRRQDIERFAARIRAKGCAIEALDLEPGWDQHDIAYDMPPYYKHGRQHVKLQLDGFVTTSLLLIIRKGA